MLKAIDIIDKNRIQKRIIELANIGKKGEKGVQRFALTPEDKEAQKLVSSWMQEAGMRVRNDNFGNLIGRKEGTTPNSPVVMIGSHIDTVPNGGRFDGTIGVIGGIEVVQAIKERNLSHEHSIEVVAFSDEEGSRFSDGLFGSKGMVGLVTLKDLQIKDKQNISRYKALESFGVSPNELESSIKGKEDVKVYFEMHIEQGPFLEKENHSVGIVTGIAGPAWLKVQVNGEAGHAGTTPMNLRKDPMGGAVEIIKEIESIGRRDSSNTLVTTVGNIQAIPGGRNVIPQSVEFTLDIRDVDQSKRTLAISQIEEYIEQICDKRGLTYNVDKILEIDPVKCSEGIVQKLKETSYELGIEAPLMISGAGHDAMFMNEITDIGMIFVRCKKGISHSPKEWADKDDIAEGTKLLLKTVQKYI